LACAVKVIAALQRGGLVTAIGGSGLLVAIGLSDEANDWDITVDGPDDRVTAALADAGLEFRDGTVRDGRFASTRWIVACDGHDIDVMVNYAIYGPEGICQLPTRVTRQWRGLPIGDPAVWEQVYRLLDRPEKADRLKLWLASHQ
jgi:hypothetical protein